MLMSTVLLALLFALGFIATFFNFPTKKFLSWLHSISAKTASSKAPPPKKSMAEEKKVVRSTGSNNRSKVELKGVFATFDKNSDGFITKQELKESLRNIGIVMEDGEIAEMVEKVDENNDGLVDLDEFCELCNSFLGVEMAAGGGGAAGDGDDDLREAFDVFDGDKDGLISEEELSRVLSSLGLNQGKRLEACKEMIRSVDVDGDGMVNFDEFKRMMRGGSTPSLIPVS
ncbi:PREDICTED: calmodulin-like protein 7 [Ipomoea nil]|uniref:calmodulin-like protein 7 n=1 Tax=Ipomoea nil TaxID=35883 RepID=UPI000900FEBD|nr:PREDICTED: calmodulin-like protein 7 [Ipomoea nil]